MTTEDWGALAKYSTPQAARHRMRTPLRITVPFCVCVCTL